MKILSVLILLAIACFCNAENPGLVAVITLPIIERIRDNYFETAFQNFGHQVIPDTKSGDVRISSIVADLSNDSPDNLKVAFDVGSNSIRVDIEKTVMSVSVHWKYKKSIISESGNAKISGTLDGMGMNIAMSSMTEDQFIIPQIDVQNFDLAFNKGRFNLDFSCHHCPKFVEKLIKKYLGDKLLDIVRDQIKSQVPKQLHSAGNKALHDNYPRTVNVYGNFGLATALTNTIVVAENHLEVPLDATVFRFDQGFSRSGATSAMPHYNAQDPGEIMMFFNNYLLNTFKNTVDVDGFKYKTTILAMDYELTLPAVTGLGDLKFEEGDFTISASPTIFATAFNVGIELTATAKFTPTITPGDATNMLSVVPTIKSLSMSRLVVVVSGEKYDISAAADYLNALMEGILNMVVIPTISIPKLPVLPLQVTKNELDFHSGYGEFGVLFEFRRQ
jgi:hypothetical protein